MISLTEKIALLEVVAARFFAYITSLPTNVRPDDKNRTGIHVFVGYLGTRNIIQFSISQPSDAAKIFAIEKAVRTHTYQEYSSANSQDEKQCQFPGCVAVDTPDGKLYASISGLKGDEDATGSLAILTTLLNKDVDEIMAYITQSGGQLPDDLSDLSSYMSIALREVI